MAGDVADPFLGLLAVGDVGVGPQHAAAFDRHAVDLDHAAVRALAIVRMRPVEDAAGADEFLHILRRVHELVGRPLVGQHRLERRLRRHQLGGQAEQVEGAPVAHLDDALGVDHHDALRHALERRLEQLRLLGQHRFAGARLLLGEDQALLLALQVADVDVDDEVHAVRTGALDDPDPAAIRQRQLERRAGVAQALRQRCEPARERRRFAGRGVLPGRPVDVIEGEAERRVAVVEPVQLRERLVGAHDPVVGVGDHHAVGHVVEALCGLEPCGSWVSVGDPAVRAPEPGGAAPSRAIGFQIRIRPTPGSGSDATHSLTPW